MKGDDRCFPRRTQAVVPQSLELRSHAWPSTVQFCLQSRRLLSDPHRRRAEVAGIHGGSRSAVVELEWRPALIDIL